MSTQSTTHNFTYHPPTPDTVWLFAEVRERALKYALWIEAHLPESRERSLAITNLEQTVFWANACIARNMGSEEL